MYYRVESITVNERDVFGDVDENPETNYDRLETLATLSATDILKYGGSWPMSWGSHESLAAATEQLYEASELAREHFDPATTLRGGKSGWFGTTETLSLTMRDGYQATYVRIVADGVLRPVN